MKRAATSIAALAVSLAGCAGHPKKVASVAPPRVTHTAKPAAPMPAGGRPGMTIPARLADGSYLTPNRNLSAAAAVWHFRAALNVAALACRGPTQAAIVTSYNSLLTRQKTAFTQAQATLATEYRAAGGNWQAREDDAMTRLYNYFSQDFARAAFCARAARALGSAQGVAPAAFHTFAGEQLSTLDQPFVDFFRAYDAWRTGATAQPTVAYAAPASPAKTGATPRLRVNTSALQDQSLASR